MAQDTLLMPKLIFGCLCIISLGIRTMCDGTEHKFSTEGCNQELWIAFKCFL